MPIETKNAVNYALTQTYLDFNGITKKVTKDDSNALVDNVRSYFNKNNIVYDTFSYDDLKTYF